ncbi:MAG: hypothetical protein IKW83_09890 [Muribaculaceae bacterium]|nr:hypothetical protein [Muribaculaceae bacterium]
MKRMLKVVAVAMMLMLPGTIMAQKKVVKEVKKIVKSDNFDVNTYHKAQGMIRAAMTNDETKGDPETWLVAAKVELGLYGILQVRKMMNDDNSGVKESGQALLDAYDYMTQALKLDTIRMVDKAGNPLIDSKTGKQAIKTKYSEEIKGMLKAHATDYGVAASELILAEDYTMAYRLFDIGCDQYSSARDFDVLAEMRYFQMYAAMMMKSPDGLSVLNVWEKMLDNGEYDLAIAVCDRLITTTPNSADLYLLKGNTILNKVQNIVMDNPNSTTAELVPQLRPLLEKALSVFEAGAAIEPENTWIQQNIKNVNSMLEQTGSNK